MRVWSLISILVWKILMDRGAWWATVHGVTESQIQLSDWNNKQQQQIPSFTYFARNSYLVMSTVRNSIYNHFPLIILLGDSHRHVSHYMHQILMLLVYYLATLAFLPCSPSFVAPISQPSAFCKSGATACCLQQSFHTLSRPCTAVLKSPLFRRFAAKADSDQNG